jgi:uncharacterized protein (DUF983 family)
MKVPELIFSTVANKCPRCHKGSMFATNNPYRLNRAFLMHEECSVCRLKYEREPGFFYGALYVSYALMSGIFILWFVADLIWLQWDAVSLSSWVVVTMIVFFPLAFRWARLIWINFFVRYDKEKHNKHIHI